MENNFNKDNVSRLLSSLRRKKGVTQAAIAEELGISDKTYSRWETGEALPDMESLDALSKYFKISPTAFFGSEVYDSVQDTIKRMYSDLSPSEQVQKSFEIMFRTVREIAQNAFDDGCNNKNYWTDHLDVAPPENRVNPGHNAITRVSFNDVYSMMYNGTDANIALALMPNEDKYAWLTDSAEREKLSAVFALLGDRCMLAMLPHILSKSFSTQYTAEHAAKFAGIETAQAEEVLKKACKVGICSSKKACIGDSEMQIYKTTVSHNMTGILTLCHLLINEENIIGCISYNCPGEITLKEGEACVSEKI